MMVLSTKSRSRVLTGVLTGISALAVAGAAMAQDEAIQEAAAEESDATTLPDALRNPRGLRSESTVVQGPRMVAGGISITSDTFLDHYARLEPIVGEFSFTGRQWSRQESEPVEFAGTWTNRWILDGLYLESSFTLNDRSGNPYQVLGLTWFDDAAQEYQARFLNSANQNQSIRHGEFDEATTMGEVEPGSAESADDASKGAAAEGPSHPTLTMFGRNAEQPVDSQPIAKFELIIVSVNEFRYVGYTRTRDGAGDDAWRKSFEMTMARIEPIEVD